MSTLACRRLRPLLLALVLLGIVVAVSFSELAVPRTGGPAAAAGALEFQILGPNSDDTRLGLGRPALQLSSRRAPSGPDSATVQGGSLLEFACLAAAVLLVAFVLRPHPRHLLADLRGPPAV